MVLLSVIAMGKTFLEIKSRHKYRNCLLVNTNVANTLLVCVQRNADFVSETINKLNDFFFTILLPEIVTR